MHIIIWRRAHMSTASVSSAAPANIILNIDLIKYHIKY